MSWSVKAVGKTSSVAKKLADDFTRIKYNASTIERRDGLTNCTNLDHTIKNLVADAVAMVLASFPQDCSVRVEARGGQLEPEPPPGRAAYSLTVKIEPLYRFIE
jgi:hypothetical protein